MSDTVAQGAAEIPVIAGPRPTEKWLNRQLPNVVADAFRVFDFLVVLLVGMLIIHFVTFPSHASASLIRRDILFAGVLTPICCAYTNAYAVQTLRRRRESLTSILSGTLIASGLLALVDGLAGDLLSFFHIWAAAWFGGSILVMLSGRLLVRQGMQRLRQAGVVREAIAIVGSGERTDRLMHYISKECGQDIEVAGIFDDRSPQRSETSDHVPIGTLDDLLTLGKEGRITKIIVALPLSAEHRLLSIFLKLKALAVDIELCPDNVGFSLLKRRAGFIGDLPLLRVAETPLSGWAYLLKSAEDFMLAGLALLLLSPLLIVTAIAIRLDSPGPILFRQKRYGFNNEPFEVLKFRTMYTHRGDQSGGRQTTRKDDRITRIGAFLRRTSIDELPQLLNVFQGTMSMVGPRPHPVGMKTANRLCEEIIDVYAHRHRVKPGITGWAQINGSRGATETPEQLERRVQLDLYYVENWSLLLDLRILLMTTFKVFIDRNAF